MRVTQQQAGVTLVEVMIGVSIIAVALVAIGYSVNAYVDARTALLNNLKSAYLAEEGYELVRSVRDDDWNTLDALSLDTLHYLAVSSTSATVTTVPEVIDVDYVRSFELHELYRGSDGDITGSTTFGASLDDDGRWLEVHVNGPNGTTTFQAIIANIHAL